MRRDEDWEDGLRGDEGVEGSSATAVVVAEGVMGLVGAPSAVT